MSGLVAIVVPCYDEADRLDEQRLATLSTITEIVDRVVFVDDGSADATPTLLDRLRTADPARIEVLSLGSNHGKAEAVRRGLRHAIATWQPTHVGYLDADLATPLHELARLVAVARDRPDLRAVIGSRVALLGHRVERHAIRHYLGRIYATLGSIVLGVPVYDTQCGAKIFLVDPTLEHALSAPFLDRWSFDVELLGRLLGASPRHATAEEPDTHPGVRMVEVPLHEWHDVGGSKLGVVAAFRATISLLRVRRALADWRRRQAGSTGSATSATL